MIRENTVASGRLTKCFSTKFTIVVILSFMDSPLVGVEFVFLKKGLVALIALKRQPSFMHLGNMDEKSWPVFK